MNIHRWRKLEGSDPSTYEMVQKIHTLQRRLIQKTQEVKQVVTNTNVLFTTHRCSSGSGKGVAYSGKGEALHGTKANSSEAARSRGG